RQAARASWATTASPAATAASSAAPALAQIPTRVARHSALPPCGPTPPQHPSTGAQAAAAIDSQAASPVTMWLTSSPSGPASASVVAALSAVATTSAEPLVASSAQPTARPSESTRQQQSSEADDVFIATV